MSNYVMVPEGWTLVPITPTPEMVEAGANADPERESVWDAMLAALPAQQAQKVLVPLKVTRAMQEVMETEGWQWEDLLAAAEAITEDQYHEIAGHEVEQPQAQDERETFEHLYAVMEPEHYALAEEYFKARPQLDSIHNRRIFESGFKRGFDARAALPAKQLSDEQIMHIWNGYVGTPSEKYPLSDADVFHFARAIERALKGGK